MFRRIAAAGLATCAAAAGLVAVSGAATSAQASFPAPENQQCPSTGYLQISRLDNFRGAAYCVNANNTRLSDNHYWFGGSVDNTASSVKNGNLSYYWALFSGTNYTGRRTNSYPGTVDEWLGNDAVGDNAVSSLYRFR
jgi:Peptidase inhibitor family I36